MAHNGEISSAVLLPETTIDMLHIMCAAEMILDRNYDKNTEHWQTAMFQALRTYRASLLKRDIKDAARVDLHEYLNAKLDRLVHDIHNAEENGFFETNNYFNFLNTSSAFVGVFRKFIHTLNGCDEFVMKSLTDDMIVDLKAIEKNLVKCISKLETDTDCDSLKPVKTNENVKINEERLRPINDDLSCTDCGKKIAVFNNDAGFSISLHMQDEEHLRNATAKRTNKVATPSPVTKSDTDGNMHAVNVTDQMILSEHPSLILSNDGKELVCIICESTMRLKPRSIHKHVTSRKHLIQMRNDTSTSNQDDSSKSTKSELSSASTRNVTEFDVPMTQTSIKREMQLRRKLEKVIPVGHGSSIRIICSREYYCLLCARYLNGLKEVYWHVKEDQEHMKRYQNKDSNNKPDEPEMTKNDRNNEMKDSRPSSAQDEEFWSITSAKVSEGTNSSMKSDQSSDVLLEDDREEVEVPERDTKRLEVKKIYTQINTMVPDAPVSSIIVIDAELIVCIMCLCPVSVEDVREHVKDQQHVELYRAKKLKSTMYQVETTDFGITEEQKDGSVLKSNWCYVNIPRRHPEIMAVFSKTINYENEIVTRAEIKSIALAQNILFEILTPRSFVCLLCVSLVYLKNLKQHIDGHIHKELYLLYLNEVSSNTLDNVEEKNEDGLTSDEQPNGEIEHRYLCSINVCKRVTFKQTTLHLHSFKDPCSIDRHSGCSDVVDAEKLTETEENISKCVGEPDDVLTVSSSNMSVIDLV